MAVEREAPACPIPAELVEFILLGPEDDRRQLQDSPILGDVWLAYAAFPEKIQDLLITPHKSATAAKVAKEISERLAALGRKNKDVKTANLAYLQGIVAARLYFDEVLRVLVPLTEWWDKREHPKTRKRRQFKDERALRARLAALFEFVKRNRNGSIAATIDGKFSALERFLALAGLISWAGEQEPQAAPRMDVLDEALSQVDGIAKKLWALLGAVAKDQVRSGKASMIFHVSLNRRATPALEHSVPAVKADAARGLFRVSCKKITWAVVDSGIDGSHPAFRDEERESRVRRTFDFRNIREIVSPDNQQMSDGDVANLAKSVGLPVSGVRARLKRIADGAANERPLDWDVVEELITPKQPDAPASIHGTHVAGIIGAEAEGTSYFSGMCPDIQLYDFRVIAKTLDDTEFAIIAALQYIRYLNEQHNYITIHGVNLSLSIPHSVRNYACGYTPVCNECERLVESGVTVVAAAGNRGYQRFRTDEGTYESYAAFSITDPGNADGVLTVGATHPRAPHSYGVSFFSSRGPTGDGRLKPDLVAPGERIQAPVPGNEWAEESGTSMAAPHVSGAAAMLMARYSELIGQPRRVKKILCESATDLGRERSFQGHGMLDVLRAFQSI